MAIPRYLNTGYLGQLAAQTAVIESTVDGLSGANGSPGADGAPGAAGATILSGSGQPISENELTPLDGIHDPWRWHAQSTFWVSPAYEISYVGPTFDEGTGLWAGASMLLPMEAAASDIDPGGTGPYVYLTSSETLQEAFAAGTLGDWSEGRADGEPQFKAGHNSLTFKDIATADHSRPYSVTTGSCKIFFAEYNADYSSEPVAPSFPDIDVADFLGTDVTVVGPHSWGGGPATGKDGDFYLDKSTRFLWGPRAAGVWSFSTAINLQPLVNTLRNGSVDPGSGDGNNGDFYINTTSWQIFGPKASGAWPTGVSLTGA